MKLKKKVKGAMVYPVVVSTIAVAVIAVIMIFVVPTFSQMFASLGGTLPLADKDGRRPQPFYCRSRGSDSLGLDNRFHYFYRADQENGKRDSM